MGGGGAARVPIPLLVTPHLHSLPVAAEVDSGVDIEGACVGVLLARGQELTRRARFPLQRTHARRLRTFFPEAEGLRERERHVSKEQDAFEPVAVRQYLRSVDRRAPEISR